MSPNRRISRRSWLAASQLLGLGCLLGSGSRGMARGVLPVDGKISSEVWHRLKRQNSGTQDAHLPCGMLLSVGKAPDGMGAVFQWDRRDRSVDVFAFINGADPLGVCISNLKKNDTLQVVSASGICSTNDGNGSLVSSIVGAVAGVAEALYPPASPLIEVGKQFANEQFGKSNRSDERDAFGQDPTNGDWCQDEGGILICLPEAGGTYYAIEGLKEKQPRFPENYPAHVQHGLFLLRSRREAATIESPLGGQIPITKLVDDATVLNAPRQIGADGDLYVLAWDTEFTDNQGFYEVHLRLSQS